MSYEGRYRETVRGFGDGDSTNKDSSSGQTLAEIIQAVDGHLVAFRGCVQSIGTQFDDEHNRGELKRLRGVVKDILTNAESELKSQRKSGAAGTGKIALDRQMRQLEQNMKVFQDLLEKERTSTKQNPLSSSTMSPFDGSSARVESPNSSVSAQALLGMSDLEQREREAEELVELESDINDLHIIQTDMATMVQDQGDDINVIEVKTEHAQARTEAGLKQVEKTVELKKKSFKLKLIIGGVVTGAIITVIIVIVIVLAAVFGPAANAVTM